jgi:hypothetical protein
VPVGQWYHLALVNDGNVTLYVNGELSAHTTNMRVSFSSSSPRNYFGMSGNGQTSDVLLDEIKMYERALTQDQIRIDMAAVGVPSSGIC